MGVFKEEAYCFEQVAKVQRRIFKDAADYGYPYKTNQPTDSIVNLIDAVNEFRTIDDKKSPDEKHFVRSRETWKDGVKVVIRIGWEIDEGFECGTQYTISFNFLGNRYAKSPNFLCHGCNAYISVDTVPYREPHKPKPETFECPRCHTHYTKAKFVDGVCYLCETAGWWIDPAGGLHQGNETDPAEMYK